MFYLSNVGDFNPYCDNVVLCPPCPASPVSLSHGSCGQNQSLLDVSLYFMEFGVASFLDTNNLEKHVFFPDCAWALVLCGWKDLSITLTFCSQELLEGAGKRGGACWVGNLSAEGSC